nr:hypothetical protein [Stigmatella aurantiaca]
MMHVINWALARTSPSNSTLLINSHFADYREAPAEPRGLSERIERAVQDYPCDILFVHRDDEGESPGHRRKEIADATQSLELPALICIIPVRMTEAWLLFDEAAIRLAAGNPHGTAALKLPSLRRLEREPDPKEILHNALEVASETTGRRLKQFQRDLPKLVQRVAELIEDFSPLESLPAFSSFYGDLTTELAAHVLSRSADK